MRNGVERVVTLATESFLNEFQIIGNEKTNNRVCGHNVKMTVANNTKIIRVFDNSNVIILHGM